MSRLLPHAMCGGGLPNVAATGDTLIGNDVLLGKTLNGKYRLGSVIGLGSLGVVYRASQLDSSGDTVRDVAVKVLRQDLGRLGDEELARNFRATVKVAAQLQTPHVLTVHDFGRAETGQFYDVMQLVDGVTLKRVLESQGALPPHLAVAIGAQLCEALQEMHGIPVAHLALRPSVILLERWPQQTWVKMREAGLVKVLGYLGNHVLLKGVPPYRAPELWAGKDAGSGVSADLYSLGVILYEICWPGGRPSAG